MAKFQVARRPAASLVARTFPRLRSRKETRGGDVQCSFAIYIPLRPAQNLLPPTKVGYDSRAARVSLRHDLKEPASPLTALPHPGSVRPEIGEANGSTGRTSSRLRTGHLGAQALPRPAWHIRSGAATRRQSHRRPSARCINCAKTSLPWFIDHPREVVLRRVAEPVRAIQVETKKTHRFPIADQILANDSPRNVGTLLIARVDSHRGCLRA